MTAAADQFAPRVTPLSARSRYSIAAASSIGFHFAVLLLVGLLAARTPLHPAVLIPIELSISGQGTPQLELAGAGRAEAPPTEPPRASAPDRPTAKRPSSRGGRAAASPAPPRLLTSRRGADPAGAQGRGKENAGSGGEQDVPVGPTRGPGIVAGPAPVYPKDALDEGLSGRVTLSVQIAADGSVSLVTIAASSSHDLLDQAAIRAVKRGWAFQPALKQGKPTAGVVTVAFEFTSGPGHSRVEGTVEAR